MASFDDFKQTVQRFGFVAGLVGAGSVLTPLVTAAAGFAPPVFDGLPYLTTLFMLTVLMVGFSLVQGLSKARFKRLIAVSATGFAILSFGYLYVLDSFVETDPATNRRVIVGCQWTSDIRKNYVPDYVAGETSECPGEHALVMEMLQGANGDPANIWTKESIRHVGFGLIALWIGMFAALTLLITSFVVSLKDKRAK